MKKWTGCSSRGLVRAGVLVLGFAVLGPAVAESQILVICGIYRDSFADTEANLCHGSGSGCAECVFIALATGNGDDGELAFSRSRNATVASYTPRLIQAAEEPDQPLSLAVNTGLPFTPPGQSGCKAPALFDRVRERGRELVPATAISATAKDRSRNRARPRVTAR